MTKEQWRSALAIARKVLGKGANVAWASDSWCAWTTFSSLKSEVNYWSRGLPELNELLEDSTVDGGLWMQAFRYDDLAHLIIPASFRWEKFEGETFVTGVREQDIDQLSEAYKAAGIDHRKTDLVLEVKCY